MPKPRWKLNTIYISERLQESLRPISRCAMTTVVAPMGYGKTTAVSWYLEERAKAETLKMIRISVYSDNLAIFWKSVQEAFARAGFDILRNYPCPTDAAGGGLLVDDLCHALADETPCYLFIDDFHLLTDKRASLFLCMLANRLPGNVHLIVASRDRFLPAAQTVRLGGRVYQIGTEQLRLNHTELAVLCPPLRHRAFRRAGGTPSLFQRGVVLRRLSESAHALRARRTAQPPFRHLRHLYRRHDRSAAETAAGVSGGHGACR